MNKVEREAKLRQRLADMRRFEDALRKDGISLIAGIDEVGRGPLAGPVCAAAVVLPAGFAVLGVDDSKKISEKNREALYEEITREAIAWGIGLVDHRRIDEINILNATKEAMLAAVMSTNAKLASGAIEHLLIDAVALSEAGIPYTAITKGDAQSISIAAASIVAKVTRDRMMIRFDKVYPGYSFASNKGYGTKAHYEGIRKLGLTPIHRRTFV
ncbi:MAG: ribonuclease HII [Clostridiales Family XIII bacterium]|jgi:ribonuclease HII|nr:ribonuclease HII [Clostridiales Family XIII bacterium]